MILINLLIAFNPSALSQYWAGYFMAQPAVPVNEDRSDLLGIPPFWAKHSVNPPFLWASRIPNDVLADPALIVD